MIRCDGTELDGLKIVAVVDNYFLYSDALYSDALLVDWILLLSAISYRHWSCLYR